MATVILAHQGKPCDPPRILDVTFQHAEGDLWLGEADESSASILLQLPGIHRYGGALRPQVPAVAPAPAESAQEGGQQASQEPRKEPSQEGSQGPAAPAAAPVEVPEAAPQAQGDEAPQAAEAAPADTTPAATGRKAARS